MSQTFGYAWRTHRNNSTQHHSVRITRRHHAAPPAPSQLRTHITIHHKHHTPHEPRTPLRHATQDPPHIIPKLRISLRFGALYPCVCMHEAGEVMERAMPYTNHITHSLRRNCAAHATQANARQSQARTRSPLLLY